MDLNQEQTPSGSAQHIQPPADRRRTRPRGNSSVLQPTAASLARSTQRCISPETVIPKGIVPRRRRRFRGRSSVLQPTAASLARSTQRCLSAEGVIPKGIVPRRRLHFRTGPSRSPTSNSPISALPWKPSSPAGSTNDSRDPRHQHASRVSSRSDNRGKATNTGAVGMVYKSGRSRRIRGQRLDERVHHSTSAHENINDSPSSEHPDVYGPLKDIEEPSEAVGGFVLLTHKRGSDSNAEEQSHLNSTVNLADEAGDNQAAEETKIPATEITKIETTKTDVAKTETAKTEDAKTEDVKTEVAKPEAPKIEAAKPEKTLPANPDAVISEPEEKRNIESSNAGGCQKVIVGAWLGAVILICARAVGGGGLGR